MCYAKNFIGDLYRRFQTKGMSQFYHPFCEELDFYISASLFHRLFPVHAIKDSFETEKMGSLPPTNDHFSNSFPQNLSKNSNVSLYWYSNQNLIKNQSQKHNQSVSGDRLQGSFSSNLGNGFCKKMFSMCCSRVEFEYNCRKIV